MKFEFDLSEARSAIMNCLRANEMTFKQGSGVPLVPFLQASPGCGKSALLRSIGSELNLKFIDVRMGTEDPVVLNGALSIDGDRSTFLPPKRFPLATDPLPLLPQFENMQADYDGLLVMKDEASIKEFQKKHCYRGWLISFDELPDAPRACQSAA